MNLLEAAKKYANGAKILADWLYGGACTVDPELAQKRADICLSCPLNQDGLKLAESVSSEIRKQLELKKHLNLKLQGEKKLKTCAGCLCPLRLKVWVPLDLVLPEPEEQAKFDSRCWLLEKIK